MFKLTTSNLRVDDYVSLNALNMSQWEISKIDTLLKSLNPGITLSEIFRMYRSIKDGENIPDDIAKAETIKLCELLGVIECWFEVLKKDNLFKSNTLKNNAKTIDI